jgi:hypothetical protein
MTEQKMIIINLINQSRKDLNLKSLNLNKINPKDSETPIMIGTRKINLEVTKLNLKFHAIQMVISKQNQNSQKMRKVRIIIRKMIKRIRNLINMKMITMVYLLPDQEEKLNGLINDIDVVKVNETEKTFNFSLISFILILKA